VPSNKKTNSTPRYKPDKQKDEIAKNTPVLTGFLLIFISLSYLTTAIKSLGYGETLYFVVSLAIFFAYIASFMMLRRGIALEKSTMLQHMLKHQNFHSNSLEPYYSLLPLLSLPSWEVTLLCKLLCWLLLSYLDGICTMDLTHLKIR
jgi:hypothetical protein